ncbi:MAG: ABC transporter ATP-binding protein [Kofleriaceae bacterium]|nr:ABC transporter ATP-binding protein [Kofleriaceae bacterium]MCL4226013.1 ABC transporter ATP-binding protein [Myxococcales bacterium]
MARPAPSDDAVIRATDLAKTYRTPFRRKKVEALRGVSFAVGKGEVFGFLGPNGAGKTTTIRLLMGLCSITAGSASILGQPVPSRAARQRLGFLPEQPYFYDYLDVVELLDLGGRLFGLAAAERRRRGDRLIERVGLRHARGLALKKFSKGMMQRAGLAMALVNDPDLVVLDEPMSGLDPVGRKEVRDLILELRDQGKTVFFSSHILSDVEQISDRVAIVVGGKIQDVGRPRELVGHAPLGTEVLLHLTTSGAAPAGGAAPAADDALAAATAAITARADKVRAERDELLAVLGPGADVDDFLAFARGHGGKVVSVTPRYETLEDLFLRRVEAARAPAAREAAS